MWNSLTDYDRLCYTIITCQTNICKMLGVDILGVDILGVDIVGVDILKRTHSHVSHMAVLNK